MPAAVKYADLVASDGYQSKYSGSAIEVLIALESDPTQVIIGATTGVNWRQDFEVIPVEEAGNDGVDEEVQGRHSMTCSIPAFWTPQWGDTLPSRQDFIGKRYIIYERIGPARPNHGTIIAVGVGATLSTLGESFGARGAKTLDLAFACTRKYKGEEWAALTGG